MIFVTTMLITIVKRISTAPIYHTRWKHRALYNNTSNAHTHTHAHTRRTGGYHGCKKKKGLEIERKKNQWRNVWGKHFQTDGPA